MNPGKGVLLSVVGMKSDENLIFGLNTCNAIQSINIFSSLLYLFYIEFIRAFGFLLV